MERKNQKGSGRKVNRVLVLGIIVVVVVVAIILATTMGNKEEKNDKNKPKENFSNMVDSNEFKMIRVDQTLDKYGKVENLDSVRWHNAMIRQNDGSMEVSIDLNNETEQTVEAKTLEVKVLDKDNKVVATKEVQMEAITTEDRYKTIDVEFEIKEYFIVYDIQIVAK